MTFYPFPCFQVSFARAIDIYEKRYCFVGRSFCCSLNFSMTFQFLRFLRDTSSIFTRDEFGLGCGSFCFRFNSPVGRRYFPKKGFVREGFRHRVLSFDLVSESTVIEQLGISYFTATPISLHVPRILRYRKQLHFRILCVQPGAPQLHISDIWARN